MIDTGEFLDIIKRENLIHKDKHLIKEGETPKYILNAITRELFESIGDCRAMLPGFRLKKKKQCPHINCVSPSCYEFDYNSSRTRLISEEDVQMVAAEISLADVEKVGDLEYLKQYNSTHDSIFRLTPNDFKIIMAYKRGEYRWY